MQLAEEAKACLKPKETLLWGPGEKQPTRSNSQVRGVLHVMLPDVLPQATHTPRQPVSRRKACSQTEPSDSQLLQGRCTQGHSKNTR